MTKKGEDTVCPVCGLTYYRYPSQIKKGRDITCSRTCAARYFRDKGEEVPCLACAKPFWRLESRRKKGFGNYCSKPCWATTRKTPFGSINNRWKREHRKWKGTICVRCGSTENLELDHIVPCSLGGQSTRDNAQTLCKTCNTRKFNDEDWPAYLASLARDSQ